MLKKKVIAARIEQLIEFPTKPEAKEFINFCKASDPQFKLIEEDWTGVESYRIRIWKSYNRNELLITEKGLHNK